MPCAGLVDDIHVIYGLGDLERAPSDAEMIKVSNIIYERPLHVLPQMHVETATATARTDTALAKRQTRRPFVAKTHTEAWRRPVRDGSERGNSVRERRVCEREGFCICFVEVVESD